MNVENPSVLYKSVYRRYVVDQSIGVSKAREIRIYGPLQWIETTDSSFS